MLRNARKYTNLDMYVDRAVWVIQKMADSRGSWCHTRRAKRLWERTRWVWQTRLLEQCCQRTAAFPWSSWCSCNTAPIPRRISALAHWCRTSRHAGWTLQHVRKAGQ